MRSYERFARRMGTAKPNDQPRGVAVAAQQTPALRPSLPPDAVAVPLGEATLELCARRLPIPCYDRRRVRVGIVHLGVGGFHRAHQAQYHDRLLAAGSTLDWGICGIGVRPEDAPMRDALREQDGLYTLVERAPDGELHGRVIGSLIRYLFAPDGVAPAIEAMAEDRVRIVSLTITEGGYNLDPDTGRFDSDEPGVVHDLEHPEQPRTAFGLVIEALRRRRARGIRPFAVMSCDNLPGNGRQSRLAFSSFARLREPGLGDWIEEQVSFPDSMVDRITPATTDRDREEIRARFGVEDRWPVVCEPFCQWVLQDRFPSGRPPYERVGVQLVEDVEPYELMKLRLLNAGHQALGHLGVLRGHRFVHEAARDSELSSFLRGYLALEAAPTLPPVPGVDLDDYARSLMERFANPHVPDPLDRVRAYASDRIPKFLLPVIRAQLDRGGEVWRAATIVAAWARSAEGVDERGQPLELTDRLADELRAAAHRQRDSPAAFIEQRRLFGDLAERPPFRTAYLEALRSLAERGVGATVAEMGEAAC
jgi:mannitol 2-dehydrogenase